jgi:hypothetical protein
VCDFYGEFFELLGFFFWSFPYAEDGILDLLCGFVEMCVGVVTADRPVHLLRQRVSCCIFECFSVLSRDLTMTPTGSKHVV